MSFVSRVSQALGFNGGPLLPATERREPALFSRSSDSTYDDLNWISQTWSSPSITGIQINQQTAMSCAAVMACVSLLAEDVAKLTPGLFRTLESGGRVQIFNTPAGRLLSAPNAWQTWMEFCGQMMLGLVLRGNGYAVIVRDGKGNPVYLVPINPDRVSLWEAPSGHLFWNITRAGLHEMAVLADVPLLVPDYDILHLKGLSANGLIGFSKIALNREAIGLALAQEQQAARWMGQGAKPSGILSTDQKMTQDVIKRNKDAWQAAQGGLINSGKTAVLEMGLKWQPLTLSAQDIEFIASRNFQKEEICALFRVPPHMIGVAARGQNQNITQQSQDYVNNTLSTFIQIWRTRWKFTFSLPPDTDADFDRSVLLEGDILARFQMYRLGLQGVLSTNEARRFEKLGPAPEGQDVVAGDRVFRPVNMAPIDADVFLGAELPGGQNPAGPGSDVTGSAPPGAGDPNPKVPDPDQVA